MITHNFDVKSGVVNGAVGKLKSIRYTVDDEGRHHAISCVVCIPDLQGPPLTSVEQGEAVALEESIDMVFRHPYSQKKVLINRTQLPVMPAFAMTAHKAQGQTLTSAIIDFASCRGTEPPYVMASRVKSLDGLLILRPFKIEKIQRCQSEDYRNEQKRLRVLQLLTLEKYGQPNEVTHAQSELKKIGQHCDMQNLCFDNDEEVEKMGNRQLDRVQDAIDRLSTVPSKRRSEDVVEKRPKRRRVEARKIVNERLAKRKT